MKRFLIILLCILLPVCAFAETGKHVYVKGKIADFAPDEPLLELWVVPLVGADAMILTCEGHTMAVDVGNLNHDIDVMKVLDIIGDRHLEMVFNSHPHADHGGSFLKLVHDDVKIDSFITAYPDNYVLDHSMQPRLIKVANEAGIPVKHVRDGDELTLGSAKLTCLQDFKEKNSNNNNSCMLYIRYGSSTLLLTADAEAPTQIRIVRDHPWLGHVDIMKAPHHGLSELSRPFMDTLRPDFSFITHGSGDSYIGQDALNKRRIPYFFASHGLIRFATNGEYWIAEQIITDPRYIPKNKDNLRPGQHI